MSKRPSKDEYFLMIVMATASRATCARRQVGAVAIDSNGYVLSTGYNGLPKGMEHCINKPCKAASLGTGEGLDVCKSIHAEINAIAHCKNPQDIHTMYVSCTPCMSCMKAIIATGCRRIVAMEIYDVDALELFIDCGGDYDIITYNQLNNKFK